MAATEPRDHRRDLMIGVGSAAAAAGAIEAYHRTHNPLTGREMANPDYLVQKGGKSEILPGHAENHTSGGIVDEFFLRGGLDAKASDLADWRSKAAGVRTSGVNPGWSDSARAKSAEVRGEKAMGKPEPRGMDGLIRSERAARDGKAKAPVITPAPAEGATSAERFRTSYEATLRKQVEANPGKYGYGVDRVPEMARKMTEALAQGAGDHTSPTVKAVAKSLGIKPTVGGLKAFLADQPPPAPRPQKSPIEKAEIAATKAEAARAAAWKGMQAGHVSSPDYVKAAQAAEAARKALDAAKAHPTTVISSGIRDSTGALHVKNPETNTWSIDKSAPKQIAPKGDIAVPGDKGNAGGKLSKSKPESSHLRGTQNEANREAIKANRKAKAKPDSWDKAAAKAREIAESDAAKIKRIEARAKATTNPNVEAVRTLSATAMGAKRKVFAAPSADTGPVKVAAEVKHPGTPIPKAPAAPVVDPAKLIDKRNETARSLAEQTKATGVDAGRGAAARDLVARNDRAISAAAKVKPVNPKVAEYHKRLEAALGDDRAHALLVDQIAVDKGMKVADVKALARLYTQAAPESKARALKKIAGRQQSMSIQRAKTAANRGRTAASFLLPIGLAAAALAGANEAKAEGLGTTGQMKAAGKEGGKAAATMGAFSVGTVAAVKGAMKLGLSAGKAIPAVNLAMMAGGAIHGAITAKPGERLAGAARGAWDMSLPGMVVNTGMAAKEAVQGRVGSSPSTGGHDMGASFAAANARYQSMRDAATATDPADKRKGWSNAARIAAAKARGASNLPYGGDATSGPSQHAPKP